MAGTFAGLQYLTNNDCSLLKDRCERKTFRAGEHLIKEGRPIKVVYLLVDGKVRVDGPHGAVAHIGEGDICGEMAFLEEGLPSASATAEEDVEAFVISWEALGDLFEMFPHLASRFYRSMAMNLSRRLRQQMALRQPARSASA